MRLTGSPSGRRNARKLRTQMAPPEIALWQALRASEAPLRLRRQHAAGDDVLDFYCAPARLAIEVDGEAHERGDRPQQDARRDAWLASNGGRVLRYSARDVLANTEGVLTHLIRIALERLDAARGARRPPLRRLRRHLPLAGEDR